MIFVQLLDTNIDEILVLGLMFSLQEVYQIHALVVLQSILEF